MNPHQPRIAINIGSGYVPGLDLVIAGAVLAAHELDWKVVGIRDGYDGILHPERYPDGGLIELCPEMMDGSLRRGSIVGAGARTDPFHVRTVTAASEIDEVDRSDDLLEALRRAGVEAVISLVGGSAVTGLHALSVAFKLQRKGLRTVCIPKAVENEIACVPQAFGYNSVLSHTAELLEGIRAGAQDVGCLAVVEVPGQHAGWLALQSGMAVLADAILLPEIPYDLSRIANALAAREKARRRPPVVIVAEGALPAANGDVLTAPDPAGLRASLSPNADPGLGEGEHIIDRTGAAANSVAVALQRLTGRDVLPFSLGLLVRGGPSTAFDRQLGPAYGAAAVKALQAGADGVMIAYQPPDLKTLPLRETIGHIRTVPTASEMIRIVRSLGIALGD